MRTTTTGKRPKMEDVWAAVQCNFLSYRRFTFQLLTWRKKERTGHLVSAMDAMRCACKHAGHQMLMLSGPFCRLKRKASSVLLDVQCADTSWSVRAPEIIRCFRACTAISNHINYHIMINTKKKDNRENPGIRWSSVLQ
jgi:hypothetical protein